MRPLLPVAGGGQQPRHGGLARHRLVPPTMRASIRTQDTSAGYRPSWTTSATRKPSSRTRSSPQVGAAWRRGHPHVRGGHEDAAIRGQANGRPTRSQAAGSQPRLTSWRWRSDSGRGCGLGLLWFGAMQQCPKRSGRAKTAVVGRILHVGTDGGGGAVALLDHQTELLAAGRVGVQRCGIHAREVHREVHRWSTGGNAQGEP
jgi:hypothetical protein